MQTIIKTQELPTDGAPLAFESRKLIDWNDSSDRKWLQNHLHWAMHNGRRVVIEPALTSPESN